MANIVPGSNIFILFYRSSCLDILLHRWLGPISLNIENLKLRFLAQPEISEALCRANITE